MCASLPLPAQQRRLRARHRNARYLIFKDDIFGFFLDENSTVGQELIVFEGRGENSLRSGDLGICEHSLKAEVRQNMPSPPSGLQSFLRRSIQCLSKVSSHQLPVIKGRSVKRPEPCGAKTGAVVKVSGHGDRPRKLLSSRKSRNSPPS